MDYNISLFSMPLMEHSFALSGLTFLILIILITSCVCIRTQNSVLCLFGGHYPQERINKAQLPLQAGMNEGITSTDVHEQQSILARRLDSCEVLTTYKKKESCRKVQMDANTCLK